MALAFNALANLGFRTAAMTTSPRRKDALAAEGLAHRTLLGVCSGDQAQRTEGSDWGLRGPEDPKLGQLIHSQEAPETGGSEDPENLTAAWRL